MSMNELRFPFAVPDTGVNGDAAIQQHPISERLRQACSAVQGKSYPLSDLITLMQQAADALDAVKTVAPEQKWHDYETWRESMTLEDHYDFDSLGRGFKKDSTIMMRLTWNAAREAVDPKE